MRSISSPKNSTLMAKSRKGEDLQHLRTRYLPRVKLASLRSYWMSFR